MPWGHHGKASMKQAFKTVKKTGFILKESESDPSSAKDQPLSDKEWSAVSGGMINFNDFVEIDENVNNSRNERTCK